MTTTFALRATALAALLTLSGGLRAQEATAWEVRGPASDPSATATTSRQDMSARMAAARAQGWHADAEVSRFSDERSADLRRMARSVHTRSAVVAETRAARRIGLLDGNAGEAGPSDETLAKREAFNELSRQVWMAQWQQPSPPQTAALPPEPAGPLAPVMPTTPGVRMSESPGIREWWGLPGDAAASDPNASASADAGRHEDVPGEPAQDRPPLPMAPGRETALGAPTRPAMPLSEGPAREGSPDSTAQRPPATMPLAAPMAAAAASEPARAGMSSALGSGTESAQSMEPAQPALPSAAPAAATAATADSAPTQPLAPRDAGAPSSLPPVQDALPATAQPVAPQQPPAAMDLPAMEGRPATLQEPAGGMTQPVLPHEPSSAITQPVPEEPAGAITHPVLPQEPSGAITQPVMPQEPSGATAQPVAPPQPLDAVELAPSTPLR